MAERNSNIGKLGCLGDMTDNWILDAFRTQVQHSPSSAHVLIDALLVLKDERKTEVLDLEIVCQRSEGIVSTAELKRAYKDFEIPDLGQDIGNDVLLGLLRATSSLGSKENLKMILKHRNNPELNELMNTSSVLDTIDQDVSLALYYAQTPVGLHNIGNTCYLNSLLQYMYTIKEIRETVINMEAYAEDESDPDWKERVIDGRTLSKKDVAEAKESEFYLLLHIVVSELKRLFMQMRSARASAVAPSNRLVELLLTTGTASSSSDVISSQKTRDFFEQQDVTETLSILFYRLSAALKPIPAAPHSEPVDRFNSLFYVKAYQTRSEMNETSGKEEERRVPADFSTLILPVATDASMEDLVDNYFNAHEPASEPLSLPTSPRVATTGADMLLNGSRSSHVVTISELPPILQVHLSRTVFDKADNMTRKSHASVSIPKRLYLDEYKDTDEEQNRGVYKKIKLLRDERREHQKVLESGREARATTEPGPELQELDVPHKAVVNCESSERPLQGDNDTEGKFSASMKAIKRITQSIEDTRRGLSESEYQIHAVFHHEGGVNFGHYWVYIYDVQEGADPRWIKYSDGTVTEVGKDQEDQVFKGHEGSTAIFCVYVRSRDAQQIVQTVHRWIE
ncbi:ubiquitin-specific protease ubp2 [Podila humilis]|nr:ubiquitin-specific protease ubp2 [Podila humilis]